MRGIYEIYLSFIIVVLLIMSISCTREKNWFANGDFEQGTLSSWGVESARKKAIEVIAAPVCSGQYAVKFTLEAGDFVNLGHRAELTKLEVAEFGLEYSYEWDFMLDESYVFDSRQQIIHQFHDWPDFGNGEDWDDHPGYSPPLYTKLQNDTCLVTIHTLTDGHKTIGKYKIKKGEWFTMRYQVKWSTEDDGYVMVHFNGEPVTPFNGDDHKYYVPTVYNKEGNYFKFGLYTDPEIKVTNTAYADNLKITILSDSLNNQDTL